MLDVAQILFCIFTPTVTLKMEALCSSKMFGHTYCILYGVRMQKTIYIISLQDHIIAYWVSCTRGAFDTEQVNRSGDACDLWWDTAVLTGLLWFSSFLWDITIWHFGHNYLPSIPFRNCSSLVLDCVWNVMAHAPNPDFIFRRNGQVRLNRWGHHFSRLLAAEVCTSAVVMLDTPCSEVVWRVLATHFICQFPLHFPSCVSLCAITFQLDSTIGCSVVQVLSVSWN
jgi:hypothetical protein